MNSNDKQVERVVEHKTVIIDNRQTNVPVQQVVAPNNAPQPVPVVTPKQSAMDMNKLSQSASYKPPSSVTPIPTSVPVKSSMDMSKLSSNPKPTTVSLSKSSAMNMSKLSKK
jgi:hypothetical protein